MTIRARTHGYTSWINMRLSPFEQALNNVIMDILRGTNMKYLLQSYTGQKNEKFQSFENMTKEQLHTRVKWLLKDLKMYHVIADDVGLDARLFAIRSAKHIFEVLWRLVCHDIFFLWERIDFLSTQNEDTLIQVPFTWIPAPLPDKKRKMNPEISQLSGFPNIPGIMNILVGDDKANEENNSGNEIDKNDMFPGLSLMRSFSIRKIEVATAPDPKACLIQMINIQLKTVVEGKQIVFTKLNELSDTRVLCGLINSFVPNLFPTEILMNDRWCINLVLRSIDKMLMCNSTMDSEDLVEAESQSICAFFCYLFMMFYKFRQCKAVVNKYKSLEINIRKLSKERENVFLDRKIKSTIDSNLASLTSEIESLKSKYDIKYYLKWIERVRVVKDSVIDLIEIILKNISKVHAVIFNKFRIKFDWFPLVEDITLSNLAFNQAINLSLTNGVGFYKLTTKEQVSRERKVILKLKDQPNVPKPPNEIPKFFYDYSEPFSVLRKKLRVPNIDPVEVDPRHYPDYEIYVECFSNNKIFKQGTIFLYQVFPNSITFYHDELMKACHEKDIDAVKRLVEFFSKFNPNFINLKDHNQNTALHVAAQNGYFAIVLYLLDNYANVNIQNKDGNTPVFLAASHFHRDCAKLLLEYGSDVTIKNNRKDTILTHVTGAEFKPFIEAIVKRVSDISPGLFRGDPHFTEKVINEHVAGIFPLCTIRSRLVNGSTLLHTSSYYGNYELVEKLLNCIDIDQKPLNPNIRDYRGATPLHRSHHLGIMKMLIDYGAEVNAGDLDGNSPLHVKSYGDKNKPSELEAIELLIYYKADIVARNKKQFLPVHLAAMQGRVDVIELIFKKDVDNLIHAVLSKDSNPYSANSPTYLALINDHKNCAAWLIKNGYKMRQNEPETILLKILKEEVIVKNVSEMIIFLCENGCSLDATYEGGNRALHYAASMSGNAQDAIKILVEKGALVDAVNDEMKTPLFMSVKANNPLAASTLLQLNADYRAMNEQGLTAFDFIKDVDEWIISGFFSGNIKAILKSYEYKQTRNLIRAVSQKLNTDFSAKAMLIQRDKTISGYINEHYKMLYANNRETSFYMPSGRAESLSCRKSLINLSYRK